MVVVVLVVGVVVVVASCGRVPKFKNQAFKNDTLQSNYILREKCSHSVGAVAVISQCN